MPLRSQGLACSWTNFLSLLRLCKCFLMRGLVSRRCSEAVSSLASGPRADSLPWFDFPLVQGASRLRYTDKAQMQRPGHTGRKALATKKILMRGLVMDLSDHTDCCGSECKLFHVGACSLNSLRLILVDNGSNVCHAWTFLLSLSMGHCTLVD